MCGSPPSFLPPPLKTPGHAIDNENKQTNKQALVTRFCVCTCWLLLICLVHHVLCVYLFRRAWCHGLSLSVYLSTLSSLPPSSLPCVFSFHLLPIIPWPPLFPVRLFRDLIIPRTPFFLPVIGLVCVASSVIPRQSHPLMQSSLLAPLCLSFVCICLPLICLLVCLLPRITSCPIFMVIIYFFIICLFLSAVPNFSLPSSTSLVH